jgi:hypothetical protein
MIKKIMQLITVITMCSACSPEHAEQQNTAVPNEASKKPFKKKVWDPAAIMTEMQEKKKEDARQSISKYLKLLDDINKSNYIVKDNKVTRLKAPTQHNKGELATFNFIKNVYGQVMPRAQLPEGAKILVIRKKDVLEVIFDKAFEERNARGRNSKIIFVDRKTNKVTGTQIGL